MAKKATAKPKSDAEEKAEDSALDDEFLKAKEFVPPSAAKKEEEKAVELQKKKKKFKRVSQSALKAKKKE